MTINEVLNTVLGMPGATMVRVGKNNFVAIPCEDGIAKVRVGTALAKETKNHQPFDFEAASAAYTEWAAAGAEKAEKRANSPKKPKGPDPEAQARRDALDAAITALPAFDMATATDIFNMLSDEDRPATRMMVGLSLKRLAEVGLVTYVTSEDPKDTKKYYTKG